MSNVHEINIVIRYPRFICIVIRRRLLSKNEIIINKLTNYFLALKKSSAFFFNFFPNFLSEGASGHYFATPWLRHCSHNENEPFNRKEAVY